MKKLESMAWWPELIEVKDQYSLRELAEKFGATAGAINNALKRNGISRKAAPPGPRVHRSEAKDAPAKEAKAAPKKKAAPKAKAAPKKKAAPKAKAAPKKKAAPKAKAAPKVVKAPAAAASPARDPKKPGPRGPRKSTLAKIQPYADMLGKAPDAEIASLADVSTQTVANYRKAQGIKAGRNRRTEAVIAKGETASGTKVRKNRSVVAPFDALLGTVPDSVIAKKAGTSVNNVRNRRARLGISAFRKQRAAARAESVSAPAPAASTPAASTPAASTPAVAPAPVAASGGSNAYRVRFGDSSGIVLAESLVEAAAKATAGGREVSAIELLGAVLG